MSPTPKDQYEQVGKSVLRDRLSTFINAGQPIEFYMLGFPFKSTNTRDKVLGVEPDFAEEVTMKNFATFNNQVKQVYSAGVNISMASDGFVFNELLGVDDYTVTKYKEISTSLIQDAPVKIYDLYDFYNRTSSLSDLRIKLTNQFGVTAEKLEQDILFNDDVNFLYRGMVRFMEEELAPKNYPSRNQLQKAAKVLTRQMMFMNEAYSNLVSSQFKNSIRLSMHPSVNNGNKYSFQLIPSTRARHSAWHCALVVDNDGYITMHRKDAEQAGYNLVYKDKQPYYFQAN